MAEGILDVVSLLSGGGVTGLVSSDYIFDGPNKLIILNDGVTQFEVVELYSRWKEWVMLSDNAKWAQAFRSVGGEPIGGGQTIAPYIFLVNGWKVRPHEADHALTTLGNLLSDDESFPFVHTLGLHNVQIRAIVSANAIMSEAIGGGGGSCVWTEEEKEAALNDLEITKHLSLIHI